MSKRARYDGPYPSVDVYPPGDVNAGPIATVERGHQLPPEVPAAIRDELLEWPDWTAVEQTTRTDKQED